MIETIPPEQFLVEEQCRSLEMSNFVAHRTTKTLTELREMGFDEEKIATLASTRISSWKQIPRCYASRGHHDLAQPQDKRLPGPSSQRHGLRSLYDA